MTLETEAAIAALDADVRDPDRLPDRIDIATDTRTLRAGQTFLALAGERFDGHAYVADAAARGAAACIVEDASAVPPGLPAIVVASTLAAYLQLGALARARLGAPVVAISGSTGKTTTKAFLAQLLSAAGVGAVATPANENNEIGVAKFLLGLEPDDPRIAIVEMGARKYRDLDVLVETARPDVAILTNVGDAHLEIMGSLARLAQTKWALFSTGARAVLDLSDAVSRANAGMLALPPLWFGAGDVAPPPGAPAAVLADARTLVVHDGTARIAYDVETHVPGEYNRRNLAAAVAAAIALGCAPATLAPHLADVAMPAGRYQRSPLAGDVTLVFDAYNASKAGTLATLTAFADEPGTRRIAVLGSMAELGDEAAAMHRDVGSAAAAACDVVLAGGAFADEIARGALAYGAPPSTVVTYATNAEAIEWLRAQTRPGDSVLLKGSRRYAMEEIARALGAAALPEHPA